MCSESFIRHTGVQSIRNWMENVIASFSIIFIKKYHKKIPDEYEKFTLLVRYTPDPKPVKTLREVPLITAGVFFFLFSHTIHNYSITNRRLKQYQNSGFWFFHARALFSCLLTNGFVIKIFLESFVHQTQMFYSCKRLHVHMSTHISV